MHTYAHILFHDACDHHDLVTIVRIPFVVDQDGCILFAYAGGLLVLDTIDLWVGKRECGVGLAKGKSVDEWARVYCFAVVVVERNVCEKREKGSESDASLFFLFSPLSSPSPSPSGHWL